MTTYNLLEPTVTTIASPLFDEYRGTHQTQTPDLSRQRFEDEIESLAHHSDFQDLLVAPIKLRESINFAASQEQLLDDEKYLWVIGKDYVKIALECGDAGRNTKRNRLSHTNFTGGDDAYAGGELWLKDERALWVNGGSSRYQPRSEDELNQIINSFERSGYHVESAGWDSGISSPARFVRIPQQ